MHILTGTTFEVSTSTLYMSFRHGEFYHGIWPWYEPPYKIKNRNLLSDIPWPCVSSWQGRRQWVHAAPGRAPRQPLCPKTRQWPAPLFLSSAPCLLSQPTALLIPSPTTPAAIPDHNYALLLGSCFTQLSAKLFPQSPGRDTHTLYAISDNYLSIGVGPLVTHAENVGCVILERCGQESLGFTWVIRWLCDSTVGLQLCLRCLYAWVGTASMLKLKR